jgi:hypothetical protein
LERLARDEHFSLIGLVVCDEEKKKFYNAETRCRYTKISLSMNDALMEEVKVFSIQASSGY